YKFNTFIAMFLIISEIYLFLFRTHVKYEELRRVICFLEQVSLVKWRLLASFAAKFMLCRK
ncbi:hypothetical protein, partial [Phocaeicola vulgatus]